MTATPTCLASTGCTPSSVRTPATEVTVSWHATQQRLPGLGVLPRRRNGHEFERSVDAVTLSYTDAKSGQVVLRATTPASRGLRADTEYVYLAVHDGAQPEFGSFRTAPSGRAAFTFTSFGDQGTPTTGKRLRAAGRRHASPNPPFVNDNLGSPAAGDTAGRRRARPAAVPPVQRRPLLRQPRHRPGAHVVGLLGEQHAAAPATARGCRRPATTRTSAATAPIGYQAYQTYFALPRPARTDRRHPRPLVRVHGRRRCASSALANDDVCLPGRRRQLRARLLRRRAEGVARAGAAAGPRATATSTGSWSACTRSRSARPTSSTAPTSASAQEWLPLFDQYGVDLVVCGHEHHYERSHPIRGQQAERDADPDPGLDAGPTSSTRPRAPCTW